MVQVSYPGVYIEEVPSGVHTVTNVSTSIAAFIDFFKEGPMNEAVQIFGMADFQRIFGGLDNRSEASYAISQFFLNGGAEAYVIRGAAKPPVPIVSPYTNKDYLNSAEVKIKNADGTADLMKICATNEGAWGNSLRVEIDWSTKDPTKYFNMYVTRYENDSNDAKPIAQESFLELSPNSNDQRFVETIVNDDSALIKISNVPLSSVDMPAPNGTLGSDISSLNLDTLGTSSTPLNFKIKLGVGSTPAVGRLEQVVVMDGWSAGDVTTLKQLRSRVEQAIRKAAPTVNAFSGAAVSLADNRLILSAGRGSDYDPVEMIRVVEESGGGSTANDLGINDSLSTLRSAQQYPVGYTGNAAGGLAAGVAATLSIPGTKGADGLKPTPSEIIGSKATEPYTGMYALDYVDLFNILCIPRAVATGVSATDTTAIISNALAYCEEQRAFMIIDIPDSINEIDEMKDWMDDNSDFRHRNAAVYFPRLKIPDPKNDYRLRSVGCSGTIAGMYSRIDGSRGVWKTPAGIEATIRGVSEMDMKLTDAQNGALNPLGINCLRTFPVYGDIVWGGRTLRGADSIGSEWKYLAVRRLALMIEESLFRGTKWVVFEGNDEPLWAQIRMNLGAYMNSLFRQGAFQGSGPKQAYYVKCDKETTTQNDINQGIVNIEVGFAPLKPAEFVVIKIQQMSGEL